MQKFQVINRRHVGHFLEKTAQMSLTYMKMFCYLRKGDGFVIMLLQIKHLLL